MDDETWNGLINATNGLPSAPIKADWTTKDYSPVAQYVAKSMSAIDEKRVLTRREYR